MAKESRPPQFKFNDLFNEHFPILFFSKVYCRVKTGEVEVNVINKWDNRMMVMLTNHLIAPGWVYIARALDNLEIFATFFCLIQVKAKKSLNI